MLIGGRFAGQMARAVGCLPEKARLQASGGCNRAACSMYTRVCLESLRYTEEQIEVVIDRLACTALGYDDLVRLNFS